eukprot:Gb_23081 [translate_table: standard]
MHPFSLSAIFLKPPDRFPLCYPFPPLVSVFFSKDPQAIRSTIKELTLENAMVVAAKDYQKVAIHPILGEYWSSQVHGKRLGDWEAKKTESFLAHTNAFSLGNVPWKAWLNANVWIEAKTLENEGKEIRVNAISAMAEQRVPAQLRVVFYYTGEQTGPREEQWGRTRSNQC